MAKVMTAADFEDQHVSGWAPISIAARGYAEARRNLPGEAYVVFCPAPIRVEEIQPFVVQSLHGPCFVVVDRYFIVESLKDAVMLTLRLD